MSHSVNIVLIADQEIKLLGEIVNVHDLVAIHLDSHGAVVSFKKRNQQSVQADVLEWCGCEPTPPTTEAGKCSKCGKNAHR